MTAGELEPEGDYDGLEFADADWAGQAARGARFMDCAVRRCALDETVLSRARIIDSVLERCARCRYGPVAVVAAGRGGLRRPARRDAAARRGAGAGRGARREDRLPESAQGEAAGRRLRGVCAGRGGLLGGGAGAGDVRGLHSRAGGLLGGADEGRRSARRGRGGHRPGDRPAGGRGDQPVPTAGSGAGVRGADRRQGRVTTARTAGLAVRGGPGGRVRRGGSGPGGPRRPGCRRDRRACR